MNALTRIEVPEGHKENESKTCLKHGRPTGSKDIAPWKRRTKLKKNDPTEEHDEQRTPVEAHIEKQTHEEVKSEQISQEEAKLPENYEISMSYVHKGHKWDRNDIVINNIFAF